jgi:hypothetical protein
MLLATVAVVFSADYSFAQTPSSLLWKITKDNSPYASYLFGTMHSNEASINVFDSTWWDALKSCNKLATEVNMSDPNELMGSLTAGMMKDSSLKDLYAQDEYDRVVKFINANLDPFSAAMIQKMKPFYILAGIMEAPQEDSPYQMILDIRLSEMASKKGVPVIGLETMKEQAASISVIGLQEQADLLLDYVDNVGKYDQESEQMLHHYQQQNLDSLYLMGLQFEAPEVLMRSILHDRNKRFTERLLPHLETSHLFCAVGALHLAGDTGLVASLRRNGYKVEPVFFQFKE